MPLTTIEFSGTYKRKPVSVVFIKQSDPRRPWEASVILGHQRTVFSIGRWGKPSQAVAWTLIRQSTNAANVARKQPLRAPQIFGG
jgi:hypothetical protein